MDHATFLSLKSYLCEDGFLAVIVPEKANTWYLHMAFSHVKIKEMKALLPGLISRLANLCLGSSEGNIQLLKSDIKCYFPNVY